ncbi:MAG: ABC transporter permease subunit [Candidatus Thorarchaeota archaeon]|nr:ABC transporter permease subunit [Candidatus Thorarchaeota archaeon]
MQELQEIFRWFEYIVLNGLPATLLLTLFGLGIGLAFGLVLALARVYASKGIQAVAVTYERIFRSIPILVLMFVIALGLPWMFSFVGRGTNAVLASVAFALGLRSSAYQAGIFRSAILSVSPGQLMAARALGMTEMQANQHIVLPQAFRMAVPAWSNEYAVVIKDTSFALAVGVSEMNKLAFNLYNENPALMLPILLALTLVYFCFTYPVTKYVGEYMTKKLRRLGLGGG